MDQRYVTGFRRPARKCLCPPPTPDPRGGGGRTYEFWRHRRRRCQFAQRKLDKRVKLLISFKIIRARVTFRILKSIRTLKSVMQKCLDPSSPPPACFYRWQMRRTRILRLARDVVYEIEGEAKRGYFVSAACFNRIKVRRSNKRKVSSRDCKTGHEIRRDYSVGPQQKLANYPATKC